MDFDFFFMKTFFAMMRIFEMSDQGFTIFSLSLAVQSHSHDPHSMKPNSNQETAAGGGGEHKLSHRKFYRKRYQLKGNTHGNIQPPIMKHPSVDRIAHEISQAWPPTAALPSSNFS